MYGATGDAAETPTTRRRVKGLLMVVVASAALAGAVAAVTIRRASSAEPELIQSDGPHRYGSKVPKPPQSPSPGLTSPKPPAIEVGKELDAYGNVIPANCKTWYDGCNTCRAMEGGFHSCTRKLCINELGGVGAAKCLDATSPQHLKFLNVYGKPLADCSGPGMALTGFTRDGTCVDKNDDAGSHHICIEMDSSQGSNFCEVTGQPNWCESDMPCADSPGGASEAILECPVRNWCVCEWAFSGYIGKAGGCATRRPRRRGGGREAISPFIDAGDAIKAINCNATNALAVAHYEAKGSEATAALACLESRCGLDAKTVDEAYNSFDKKEPWNEVLS